jgi:hypothetical protein
MVEWWNGGKWEHAAFAPFEKGGYGGFAFAVAFSRAKANPPQTL